MVVIAGTACIGNAGDGVKGAAQAFYQSDHAIGIPAHQIRYEYLLSQTVFAGFPATASVTFYELPSFEPENGVWMNADKNGYIVVLAHAQTNLWHWAQFGLEEGVSSEVSGKIDSAREKKLFRLKEGVLSRELGKRVEKAWHSALRGITGGPRNPGVDGITLIFRAYSADSGLVSWDAWNPLPGSLAARMQRVARSLGVFCEVGTTAELEAALLDLEKNQSTPLAGRSDVLKK